MPGIDSEHWDLFVTYIIETYLKVELLWFQQNTIYFEHKIKLTSFPNYIPQTQTVIIKK